MTELDQIEIRFVGSDDFIWVGLLTSESVGKLTDLADELNTHDTENK